MERFFRNIIKQIVGSTPEHPINTATLLNADAMGHYPEYLYKYRYFDAEENGINTLKNDYLWADHPTSFDDPLDAAVNLKLKTELKDIERWLYQHLGEIIYFNIKPKGMAKSKNGQTLAMYKEAQAHFLDENGKPNAKAATSALLTEINKLPYNQRQKALKAYKDFESPDFEKKVEDAIRKTLSGIVNSLRDKTMLTSLTARKDNQKMWEDYSSKYTGFVIEYKRPDYAILNDDQKRMIVNLFPVSYYKRIPGVPLLPFIEHSLQKELYGKTSDISDAITKLFCQLLYKKIEYNSEEEWRLITDGKEHKITFPFISAVYAGYKIADKDLDSLKDICQKKGIPLYKQEIHVTGKMGFRTILESKHNA